MLELPPIEQIEFFPSSLHLSVSTECLHPCHIWEKYKVFQIEMVDKGNNKITELRTILQRESPNS